MSERCGLPVEGLACGRLVGHEGMCYPLFHTSRSICRRWMPQAEAWCGRTLGHGGGHRSRWSMDNKIAALRRRRAA